MSQTLLLSDLHLSKHTPDFNHILQDNLSKWAIEYDALYLLGDIFDIWLGDDIVEEYAANIIDALQNFSKQKPLYFMHGNRDFLIGQHFLKLAGATLLEDPHLTKIYDQFYILSHGDLLCTDDIEYQKFRTKTRSTKWQNNILKKPKWYRKILAKSIRNFSSIKGKTRQQIKISDATEIGIQELKNRFAKFPEADIIHGHTHRPQIHMETFNLKQAAYPFSLYVLPDWRPNICGGLSINEDNQVKYINFKKISVEKM
ncbi:UDP-2,3-diacylglucosamine diphosphatase [Neisseriaceae bacterium PsAf]|nr:UDP-2,3-diacylglucosamine diphosphatase [Neisseriaceae bacterium PsAf]